MNITWADFTRASGVIATVLIALSLVWGLRFSGRSMGDARRPNWWLDLHKYLGGLALIFSVGHVVGAYQDPSAGIGLVQVLVPLTATGWAWGITWGVVALYILIAVVATSWPTITLSRRTWLAVHLLSIPAAVATATHAWMVGSDARAFWFRLLLAMLLGAVVYPGVLRLFAAGEKRRRARERQARAPQHYTGGTTHEPAFTGRPR